MSIPSSPFHHGLLGARILSVVDCFDALTSDRPYRPSLSTEEAFAIIRERRSEMYDPLVVDTFLASHAEIEPLANRAGQEARSLVDATALLDSSDAERKRPTALTKIRASAADRLACHTVSGDEHRLLQGLIIELGERVTGWSAANRRTSMNSDASLDLAQIATFFTPPMRSTISTPLTNGDLLLGGLTAYSPRESAFSEGHRYAFEQLSEALADRLTTLASKPHQNVVSFLVHG